MDIILVDDNISTTSLLKSSIDWKSLKIDKVFSASSAQEAKEILEKNNIDILICDIEMPQQDGISLVRELREQHSKIVCLFLTAHADFELARAAIELNSIDYILKPFNISELTKKIEKAVEIVRRKSQDSKYIKYGKAWFSSHNPLSEKQKKEILMEEDRKENEIVSSAKDYIRDNYAQEITLQEIAEHVHHNSNYLIRLFKKVDQTTPMDYLNLVRIQQAQMLLASDKFTISQVSLMAGFNSTSYFSKIFKKTTGITPSEYKAQIHSGNV